MNYIKGTIISLLLIVSLQGFAQKDRFVEVSQFSSEMIEMMTRSKSAEALEMATSFDAAWNGSSFSEEQKKKVIQIGNQMYKKGFRASHFGRYISVLTHAVVTEKISTDNLNGLLEMTLKTINKQDNKEINTYFKTLKSFFEQKALFTSTFNKLYVENSDYKFDFIEYVEPEIVEEETPPTEEGNKNEGNEDGWFSDWDDESTANDDWNTDWSAQEEQEIEKEKTEEIQTIPEEAQPAIEGPVIVFSKVDLVINTPFDSVSLGNATGTLMLKNNIFVGVGGKFDWSSTGLNPDEVYCEFDKFNFDITRSVLSAEHVKMYYAGKVDNGIAGVFDFESKKHKDPSKAKFPRFKSYDSNVKVKLLDDKKLNYKGGFSLEGNKISSSSVYSGLSTIEVKKEGVTQFISKSNRFIFNDSIVEAKLAAIVIYNKEDSITHPAIRVRYNFLQDLLVVQKDDGRYKNSPFFASYFNMSISADMIKWDLQADSLDISILNAREQVPAYFESLEYYNKDRFGKMVGMYKFHPLLMVVGYSRKINSPAFNVDDLVRFSKQNKKVVKSAMEFLMGYQYIDFNPATGEIKVRRKAYHNVLSKNNRKDFDNLLIPSKSLGKPNGTYFLKKDGMTIRGVDKFYISKLLDVYIVPRKREIHLMKNRDFKFDGELFAGNFQYFGSDFTFNYKDFKVRLNSIDSIQFYVMEKRKDGSIKKVKVNNKMMSASAADVDNDNLKKISGTLFINKPKNKSGRKIYPGYPYFNAEDGAIVYFNSKKILGGAYSDMSIYFEIPPFKIDSLNDSDVSSMSFDGTFVTDGLLPDFHEKLTIMPDKSLGFVHQAPIDGYEIKGGKGKVFDELTMDNNGLRAHGKIEYLNTTLVSDDFVFYPDSITTKGTTATITKGELNGASFPDLYIKDYSMSWQPALDSMSISNKENPFKLYDSTAHLNGSIVISPKGLTGKGQVFNRGSEATSDSYIFNAYDYTGKHADFEIKSDNPEKAALKGKDVKLYFDMAKNFGEISPEVEGVAAINFPYAQMKTSITKATWDLENKMVTMVKPEDVDISSSYFYSTRKALDSLAFNADSAVYVIDKQELHISGIPFIKVADAKITPEGNALTVLENSELQTLENATLVIDTLNEYHHLSEGTITIISRTKFEGDATYNLISAADTFNIKFDQFKYVPINPKKKRSKFQTVSEGTIEESDHISVSPRMIFKGSTTMYATKRALNLDGFVKLDLDKSDDIWIKYETSADTQQVIIDYEKIITDDGQAPSSGLHFSSTSYNLYDTFLGQLKDPGDEDFFAPHGILSYDENKKVFRIEDLAKTNGLKYEGKSYVYDDKNATTAFEGPLNFTAADSPIKIKASGKGTGNLETKEFDINAFMLFDFDLPSQAMKSVAVDIQYLIERLGIPEAHSDKTRLLYKLADVAGEKAAKNYEDKSQKEYTSLVWSATSLVKSLVLSDINLKWSDTDKAFYSVRKKKIGISNIGKEDINALVDGFVELRKTENGDVLNIFLKISSSWDYFGFSDNRLVTYSNNNEYNDIIKDKTNVAKAKIGEYVFILGELSEVQNYVNEFRKVYYDINDAYTLDQPTQVTIDTDTSNDAVNDEEKTDEDDDDDGF